MRRQPEQVQPSRMIDEAHVPEAVELIADELDIDPNLYALEPANIGGGLELRGLGEA